MKQKCERAAVSPFLRKVGAVMLLTSHSSDVGICTRAACSILSVFTREQRLLSRERMWHALNWRARLVAEPPTQSEFAASAGGVGIVNVL